MVGCLPWFLRRWVSSQVGLSRQPPTIIKRMQRGAVLGGVKEDDECQDCDWELLAGTRDHAFHDGGEDGDEDDVGGPDWI